MSTILKALKKLEQDRETKLAMDQAGAGEFSTRFVVQRAVRSAWLGKVGLFRGFLLFVAVLAFLAGYVYFHTPKTAGPAKSSPHKAATTESIAQGDSHPPATRRGPHPKTPIPSKGDAGVDLSQVRSRRQEPVSVDIKRPSPGGGSYATIASKFDGDGRTAQISNPSSARAAKVVETRQPSIPSAGSVGAETSRYDNVQRLTDGKFKVQAIAWSPQSEDRMAVINNQVVREGSTVDGFSIVAIEEQTVIIKGQGQLWKVVFGRP